MADEKVFNVPLRRGFQKSARWKRTKKAISVLKQYLMQHMKCELSEIRIGKHLNGAIWTNGIKNPPHHVKIHVLKDKDGIVRAELIGHEIKLAKEKKEKKEETLVDKIKQKVEGKPKKEETKPEKQEPKKEDKKEKTEIKKEVKEVQKDDKNQEEVKKSDSSKK